MDKAVKFLTPSLGQLLSRPSMKPLEAQVGFREVPVYQGCAPSQVLIIQRMKQVWGGVCGRLGKLFYFRCDEPK